MPVALRPLSSSDFDAVHDTFVEAFSDYVVQLSPTREQLYEMLTRRGYVPELSVGIFDGPKMVAFTLNGVAGGEAYDSGTGVVPSHRRLGLARRMLEFVCEQLRERGYTRYVLEVIEENEPAVMLYLDHGFSETRRLQCWTYTASRRAQAAALDDPDWIALRTWWDVEPSWQNSTVSLDRAGDRRVVLGDEHGYAVLFPDSGDLPQLAVSPAARRQGLGMRLLDAAATLAGKPLRIMNVDARCPVIDSFLTRAGATRLVRQIEMARAL